MNFNIFIKKIIRIIIIEIGSFLLLKVYFVLKNMFYYGKMYFFSKKNILNYKI